MLSSRVDPGRDSEALARQYSRLALSETCWHHILLMLLDIFLGRRAWVGIEVEVVTHVFNTVGLFHLHPRIQLE